MKLLSRLERHQQTAERMLWPDYLAWVEEMTGFGMYPASVIPQSYPVGSNTEIVATDFASNAAQVYKRNGPIFALMAFRMALFSQVRWNYQNFNAGRPGDLWSNPTLDVLNDDPYLASRMIQDVDLAGNFYGALDGGRIWRMRPDWVQVIADRPLDEYDADVLGYGYYPGGVNVAKPEDVRIFKKEEVVHWWPQPDPEACWRGMSWLTPVAREVAADNASTSHKLKFFENGATPNLVVKMDKDLSIETFEKFKEKMDDSHRGVRNAYKTMYVGGGADVSVVGADLKQLDFAVTQGKGESRLAAAARVPAVLVGFSEGMQAATYSNFGQARRGAADSLLYPLWTSAAGALGEVIVPPSGSRLWYDARDIPFLREDAKDNADIKAQEALTIRTLVDAGYEPASAISAVQSGDWSLLVHTGLFSVQLQAPGSTKIPGGPADAAVDKPAV